MTNAAKDAAPGLLPCPFCGGPAKVSPVRDGFAVYCRSCFAEGPPEFHGPQRMPSTEQRAIAAWNHRSPEALAASPVVQAMLREARAEGMEWAAAIAAETAADAKKEPGTGWASHSWLMAVCRTLEAEAAAVRKGETK